MNVLPSVPILNTTQIEQKIARMAYQVYEQNFEEQHIVVAGIADRGWLLAKKIFAKLKEISDIQLEVCKITINKDNPSANEVLLEPRLSHLSSKVVILCDDVLYTGKTMAYATVPFLQANVKKLQCLALIQRSYLHFPVAPAYIGMSLSTTLQQHVSVQLNDFDNDNDEYVILE